MIGEAPALPAIDLASLPLDTPCFPDSRASPRWQSVRWLDRLRQLVIGQCVGKSAIEAIQDAANHALIERGWRDLARADSAANAP